MLLAAFDERTGGLAFEIEQDEIAGLVFAAGGAQGLPEVVVAVDANALAGRRRALDRMGAGRSSSRRRESSRPASSAMTSARVASFTFSASRAADNLGVDAARIAAKVLGGEGLGGERGIVGVGGEGEVHLGGAPAEKRGRLSDGPACSRASRRRFGCIEKAGRSGFRWGGKWRHGGEEACELIEEPLPAVALVGHQALEHGDRGPFPSGGSDGDVAEKGRDAGKAGDLGEETADLDVGVFARLKAPEQLQDEFLAIKDGGVGLFGRADARGRWRPAKRAGERGGGARIEPARCVALDRPP